jgi:hypothetical protein
VLSWVGVDIRNQVEDLCKLVMLLNYRDLRF